MPTVEKIANDWLKYRKGYVSPQTIRQYKTVVNNAIIPSLGDRDIASITNADLQDLAGSLAYERKRGHRNPVPRYSKSYVSEAMREVRSILQWAQKFGKLEHLPALSVEMPRTYDYSNLRTKNKLSAEQAAKLNTELLDIIEHPADNHTTGTTNNPLRIDNNRRYALGTFTGLRTGMRIGEICALDMNDVNRKGLYIAVTSTVSEYTPIDSDKAIIERGATKSESGYREVPITSDVMDVFDTYAPKSGYLIPGRIGSRIKVPPTANLRAWWRRNFKDGREDYDHRSFHELRHTYANILLDAGVDYKTVAEILGHSDPAITQRFYAHPDLENKRAAVEAAQGIWV
jgi:integrase